MPTGFEANSRVKNTSMKGSNSIILLEFIWKICCCVFKFGANVGNRFVHPSSNFSALSDNRTTNVWCWNLHHFFIGQTKQWSSWMISCKNNYLIQILQKGSEKRISCLIRNALGPSKRSSLEVIRLFIITWWIISSERGHITPPPLVKVSIRRDGY